MADVDLRAFLETLDPKARDDLRRVLISELYGWPQTFVGKVKADAMDRAELLQAERDRWTEFSGLVSQVPMERMDNPTVNPDGWSIKDSLWHMRSWDADIAGELERMSDGTFVDHDWDTGVKNARFLEEGRRLDAETVKASWIASHERAVEAMTRLPDVTPTVEEWFSEVAYKHPDDHMVELRRWVSEELAPDGLVMSDPALRDLLLTLDPKARDDLRRVLVRDLKTWDRICKLYGSRRPSSHAREPQGQGHPGGRDHHRDRPQRTDQLGRVSSRSRWHGTRCLRVRVAADVRPCSHVERAGCVSNMFAISS